MHGMWCKTYCQSKNIIMYLKIHNKRDSHIIALCDEDLIGKKFEEKDLQLEVSESFYKGEILPEDKIIELLKNFNNINIVGKKSINLAIKNKIIEKGHIIKIKNIPHAQVIGL